MDPISVIVAALAAGAAAGVKPTAEQAIKDAYAGLKGFIQRKWGQVNVSQLEANPTSEARRTVVKEDLAQTEAAKDRELLALADTLLDAVSRHAPDAAKSVGVRLEDFKSGGALRIRDVTAGGTGVDVKNADVHGDIDISGIRAGRAGEPPHPTVRQ
jgi:outer membrane receptor for Fe3+-dicitrate